MKNNVTYILFVVVVLLLLYIVNTPLREVEEVVTRDTVKTVDTLIVRDTFTVTVDPPPPDTVYAVEDTVGAVGMCKDIREYTTSFSDSLLEGSIKSTVQGKLLNQEISYTPLFPLRITNTQTITETIRMRSKRYKFLVGTSVTLHSVAPTIGLQAPQGHIFTVGYGIYGSPHVSIQYNVSQLWR